MSCYCTCPLCGANLDPGERCDCQRGEHIRPYTIENTGEFPKGETEHAERIGRIPRSA